MYPTWLRSSYRADLLTDGTSGSSSTEEHNSVEEGAEDQSAMHAALNIEWVQCRSREGVFASRDFEDTTAGGYALLNNPHVQTFFDRPQDHGTYISIQKIASMSNDEAVLLLERLQNLSKDQSAESIIRRFTGTW
jgi:hypothetical protein